MIVDASILPLSTISHPANSIVSIQVVSSVVIFSSLHILLVTSPVVKVLYILCPNSCLSPHCIRDFQVYSAV